MKKKYWFSVYADMIHTDSLFLLYVLMLFVVSFITKNPASILGWIAILVLLVCILRISWFVRIDAYGICVHRLFRPDISLQWKQLTHWGTITKTLLGRIKVTYVYFSCKPMVSAPWEKLPQMNDSLIYLTYQERIIQVLKSIGQLNISSHLFYKTRDTMSNDMRRRLALSAFAVIITILVVLFYFIVTQPIMIPFLILPLFHVIFVSLSTIAW